MHDTLTMMIASRSRGYGLRRAFGAQDWFDKHDGLVAYHFPSFPLQQSTDSMIQSSHTSPPQPPCSSSPSLQPSGSQSSSSSSEQALTASTKRPDQHS